MIVTHCCLSLLVIVIVIVITQIVITQIVITQIVITHVNRPPGMGRFRLISECRICNMYTHYTCTHWNISDLMKNLAKQAPSERETGFPHARWSSTVWSTRTPGSPSVGGPTGSRGTRHPLDRTLTCDLSFKDSYWIIQWLVTSYSVYGGF